MTNKIMVASGQKGYHPVLVNHDNRVIQTATPHPLLRRAQAEAALWAKRAVLRFDDSYTLPRAIATHTQLQVGQRRSVRAYLGA